MTAPTMRPGVLADYVPDPREAEEAAEESEQVEIPGFDPLEFLWLPYELPIRPDHDPELALYGVHPDDAIDPHEMFKTES